LNIAIVNYGLGNINSLKNAIFYTEKKNVVDLVNNAEELYKYDKIILPGVGAFGDAMKLIRKKNFDEALLNEKKKGKYIFGICLGMQLLASKSFEFGEYEGLNFIKGEVLKFNSNSEYRVPHMGWNNLKFKSDCKLFNGIEENSDFYFVHSFYFKCKDDSNSIGITNYNEDFTSVVKNENIIGTQFHPEKSQKDGIQLIKNFIEL
jgi:glutamine amidotransferase